MDGRLSWNEVDEALVPHSLRARGMPGCSPPAAADPPCRRRRDHRKDSLSSPERGQAFVRSVSFAASCASSPFLERGDAYCSSGSEALFRASHLGAESAECERPSSPPCVDQSLGSRRWAGVARTTQPFPEEASARGGSVLSCSFAQEEAQPSIPFGRLAWEVSRWGLAAEEQPTVVSHAASASQAERWRVRGESFPEEREHFMATPGCLPWESCSHEQGPSYDWSEGQEWAELGQDKASCRESHGRCGCEAARPLVGNQGDMFSGCLQSDARTPDAHPGPSSKEFHRTDRVPVGGRTRGRRWQAGDPSSDYTVEDPMSGHTRSMQSLPTGVGEAQESGPTADKQVLAQGAMGCRGRLLEGSLAWNRMRCVPLAGMCILALTCLCSAAAALKDSSVSTGFVSINCGGRRWVDPATSIVYQADNYYSTGTRKRVRKAPASDTSPTPRVVERTLREFRDSLSCYMFPVPPGKYLVRLTFLYGNYNGQNSPPIFNISVGTINAATFSWNRIYRPTTVEMLMEHTPTHKELPVCFIQWPGYGAPFVNAIELRPMPSASYALSAQQGSRNVLQLFWRLHCGGPRVPYDLTAFDYRYPKDTYDRIWYPDWVAQEDEPDYFPSTALYVSPERYLGTLLNATAVPSSPGNATVGGPNMAPVFIQGRSRSLRGVPAAAGATVKYDFLGLGHDGEFEAYLYFSNIHPAGHKPGQLAMNIFSNGTLVFENFDPAQAVNGLYGAVATLSLRFRSNAEDEWSLWLRAAPGSTVKVPFISGIEIYQIFGGEPETPAYEIPALRAIQAGFGYPQQLESWQGNDPCQPVTWSGLRCSTDGSYSTVLGIFLPSLNISGFIAPEIGNLTDLIYVWLYNNNISGIIPSSLSKATNLQNLQIQDNQLVGGVPSELAQLSHLFQFSAQNNNLSGPFPFNVTASYIQIQVTPGNDHLCYNFSNNTLFGLPYCGDMKFPPPPSIAPLPTPFPFSPPPPATPPTSGTNSTLPIVASLITVCVVALLAIGGILLMLCLRRRKRRRQEEKAAAQARAEALDSGVPGASPLTGDPLLLSKSHGSQDKSTEGYQAPGLGSSGMLSGSGGANGDGSGGYFAFDEDMSPFLAALHGNARIRCMTLAELEAATDSFSPGFMIGSGGFGAVFRGTLSNGVLIAVKKRASNSQQGTKEFCNELELLSRAYHPHLVALLGFCVERGNQILVYEFMSRGTVRDHLYDAMGKPLGNLRWLQRLSVAVGAAKGIEYLHTGLQPSIIHRDIKTSNILLDDNFSAKLADFGLSRLGPEQNDSHVSTNVKGTAGYLDPEYYTVQHLTDRSDVFSFGVVLLELISGRQPIDLNRPRAEWNIVDWARAHLQQGNVEAIADPTLSTAEGPGYLLDAMWKVAEIGILCVEPMGVNRPSISDVVQELTEAVAMELQYNRSSGDSNLTFSESPSPPSDGERTPGPAPATGPAAPGAQGLVDGAGPGGSGPHVAGLGGLGMGAVVGGEALRGHHVPLHGPQVELSPVPEQPQDLQGLSPEDSDPDYLQHEASHQGQGLPHYGQGSEQEGYHQGLPQNGPGSRAQQAQLPDGQHAEVSQGQEAEYAEVHAQHYGGAHPEHYEGPHEAYYGASHSELHEDQQAQYYGERH